jgi:hypothetical protein
MQELIRDPVELNAPELDAVAGGFGDYFHFDFAMPQHYNSTIEEASEQRVVSGNGNRNGNGTNGNGQGNGVGNVFS